MRLSVLMRGFKVSRIFVVRPPSRITAPNRTCRDHGAANGAIFQSTPGANTSPRFLITIHARCRTTYDFPRWSGYVWAQPPDGKRGFHIGYRRRGGGACISYECAGSQKLMRGLDRRHARSWMYPGAASRIHGGPRVRRSGEREEKNGKIKYPADGPRHVARRGRSRTMWHSIHRGADSPAKIPSRTCNDSVHRFNLHDRVPGMLPFARLGVGHLRWTKFSTYPRIRETRI